MLYEDPKNTSRYKYQYSFEFLCSLNCDTAFHAYGMLALTKTLGMDSADADKLCTEAMKAARNKLSHGYDIL